MQIPSDKKVIPVVKVTPSVAAATFMKWQQEYIWINGLHIYITAAVVSHPVKYF